MKSFHTYSLAVCAALATLASAATASSLTMAHFAASRSCSGTRTWMGHPFDFNLAVSKTAFDGNDWMVEDVDTDAIAIDSTCTFSTSLPGYTPVWKSYEKAGVTPGPSAATRTLATGEKFDLSTVYSTLVAGSVGNWTLVYIDFTPITYGLNYALDSGSWPYGFSAPQKATYDVAFTLQNPSKTGYTFAGWDADGTLYPCGSGTSMTFSKLTVETNATVTMTAQWTPQNYTLKLVFSDGVAEIRYRVQSAAGSWPENWQSTSVGSSVPVPYGRKYECWAETAYGYSGSGEGWSAETPLSGTMTDAGATFKPVAKKNTYTVRVQPSSTERGSVSGGGSCEYLSDVQLTATPADGYRFASWSDGSVENPYLYTVRGSVTLTANFVAKSCELQLVVGDGVAKIFHQIQNDDVWSDVRETDVSTSVSVPYGTRFKLWAATLPGWELSGTGSSQGAAVIRTMGTDGFVFEPKPARISYEVVVSSEPSAGGTSKVNAGGKFTYGERAYVEANANTGYDFVRWDETKTRRTGVSTNTKFDFPVTNNTYLTAVFEKKGYAVTFIVKDAAGNDRELVQKVAYGESAVEPSVEVRNQWAGHAFTDWDSDEWRGVTREMKITAGYEVADYTVRFEGNGETSGKMDDQVFARDADKSLTKCLFARTGYTFVGWAREPAATKAEFTDEARITKPITDASAVILYAIWTPNAYTVVFDPGEGEGAEMPGQSFTYDAAKPLSACTYARDGVAIDHWETADGVTYADQETVVNLTAEAGGTVTLVAKWTKVAEYTIFFEGNGGVAGGTNRMSQTVTKNEEDALRANTFVRPGSTFVCWSSSRSASVSDAATPRRLVSSSDIPGLYSTNVLLIADQALITPSMGHTFYAVWRPNTYQVSFDPGEGSGTVPPTNLTYGVTYDFTSIVTNNTFLPPDRKESESAYTFLGWSTNRSASVSDAALLPTAFSNLTTLPDDHIRLTAVWRLNPGEKSKWIGCDTLNLEGDSWACRSTNGVNYLKFEGEQSDVLSLKAKLPDHARGRVSFSWRAESTEETYLLVHAGTGDSYSFDIQSTQTNYLHSGTSPSGWQTATCDIVVNGENAVLAFECYTTNQFFDAKYAEYNYYRCSISNVTWTQTGSADQASVTFDLKDGTRIGGGATSQTVKSGQSALEPTVEPPAGQLLAGWRVSVDADYSPRPSEASTLTPLATYPITTNTTFTADYTNRIYHAYFANTVVNGAAHISAEARLQGLTFDRETTGLGSDADRYPASQCYPTIENDPERNFDRWVPDAIPAGTTSNVIVRAIWKVATVAEETNTVTFVFGSDYSVTNAVTVIGSGKAAVPPTVTNEPGFVFAGWDKTKGDYCRVTTSFTTRANYTAEAYPITYANLKGCTHENPAAYTRQSFASGDLALTPPVNTELTLRFLGWNICGASGEIAPLAQAIPATVADAPEALTVTAVWAYRLSFSRDDDHRVTIAGADSSGSVSGYLTEGVGATNAPTVTVQAGYSLAGWKSVDATAASRRDVDQEGYLVDAAGRRVTDGVVSNVTQSTSLQAAVTANVYRVEYEGLPGGVTNSPANPAHYTVETETVVFAEPSPTAFPDRDRPWLSHRFDGWTPSCLEKGTTGDQTVTAAWSVVTGSYDVVVGGKPSSYRYGETVTASTDASVTNGLTNVVCVGWVGTGSVPARGTGNTVTFTVTGPGTLDWQYQTNYWVSAEAAVGAIVPIASSDGGTVALTDAIGTIASTEGWFAAGTNLTATATAATGWSFARWETGAPETGAQREETGASRRFTVLSPVALTAVFTQNVYSVTFKLDDHLTHTGGGALEQTVVHGASATPPTVNVATGYAFEGWFDADGNPVDAESLRVITKSQIIYGRVTKTKFDVTVSVADGCEKMGTVSGAKTSVKPGTKVTVKATAKSGYLFSGWYDAVAASSSSTDADCSPRLRGLVSRLATYSFAMPSNDVALVAKFLAKGEDWAEVSVAGVADEYAKGVEIDPIAVQADGGTVPTVKVTGLPTGLKFTAKLVTAKKTVTVGGQRVTTLVTNALPNTIYGTPTRSGLYTAVVTATTVGKATASTNVTFVVVDRAKGESVVRTSVVLVDADYSPRLPGKTTGQGVYAAGKKVTLKAIAYAGYVFSGWYDASKSLVSRLASLALVVPDADVTYGAAFVTKEDDAASIAASVNGLALVIPGDAGLTVETNVSAGVYLAWPVLADAASATTVAVSGLPAGLKFTAKPVVTKQTATVGGQRVTTVVTNVPAMTIYGTPTAGGKTTAVKVTVKTAGKNTVTGTLKVTVDALPAWLVATYAGGSTNDAGGSATLTVAKTGKISGKWISDGQTWTLTATGFDLLVDATPSSRQEEAALSATVDATSSSRQEADGSDLERRDEGVASTSVPSSSRQEADGSDLERRDEGVASTAYVATNVTAKCGKEVETLTLVFAADAIDGESVGVVYADFFTARGANWKVAPWKALAAELKGAAFDVTVDADCSPRLQGKVAANGSVSVKGTFALGTSVYAATAKGTLQPLGADASGNDTFELYLYYPPKKNKFDGYAARLVLVWDGAELTVR